MLSKKDDFRDPGAERAVLAGICKYGGDAFVDVDDLIDANAFGDDGNWALFSCLEHFYGDGLDKKLDLPSILSTARSLGLGEYFGKPEDMRHLRDIFQFPIEKETIRREAKKLYKLYLTRELDEIYAQTRREFRNITGDESIDEIQAIAESPVFDFFAKLNKSESDGPKQIAYGIDEFLDSIEANPRDNIGISSGFALYDYYIGGGFRRATVSIIGARMKVGKTIFCDNIALHVAAKLKIPVLNLDTEMTREEHQARILSHVCSAEFDTTVTIREIETGGYAADDEKREAVRQAAEWLKAIPYEYDSVVEKSFEEQVAIIRRWVRRRVGYDEKGRTKDCLVIYDYLQPPEYGEFGKDAREHQILGYQMLSLLRTASKCDVPIFTLVQLNRDGITNETTGVVADSDRPLRKGANFAILKWKSEEELAEDGEEAGTHKLVIIITRHGEAMAKGDYINIRFDGKSARMIERGTRNELQRRKKDKRPKGFEVEVPEGGDKEEPIDF
jgi:replicative DNA helicase